MKTSISYQFIWAFIILGVVFGVSAASVEATVGGPTYVGSLKYNRADESVYFTSVSESGRGCPPILQKISLVSEQVSTVYSCDEGEKLTNADTVEREITRLTTGFKDLTPLSLSKSNIQVDLKTLGTEKVTGEADMVLKTRFMATVYQNGQKVDEFPIAGCSADQPFTFAGYAIPGFDKKIILLSSAKGDCWEGGYIYETPYVVGGLNALDKTVAGSTKTPRAALAASDATITVAEKDTVTVANPGTSTNTTGTSTTGTTTDDGARSSTWIIILVVIVALIAGFAARSFRRTEI